MSFLYCKKKLGHRQQAFQFSQQAKEFKNLLLCPETLPVNKNSVEASNFLKVCVWGGWFRSVDMRDK